MEDHFLLAASSRFCKHQPSDLQEMFIYSSLAVMDNAGNHCSRHCHVLLDRFLVKSTHFLAVSLDHPQNHFQYHLHYVAVF